MIYVKEKTANGTMSYPADTELFDQRKIFIEGEINNESALDFLKKIVILSKEDKPIDVYINSPGGDVAAGLLIYDIIQTTELPIRMFCCGDAFSMAAIIFCCGKHNRYMLPHSRLMLHEPIISSSYFGNASSVKTISESLQNIKNIIVDIISKHSHKNKKDISKDIEHDLYLNANESLEYGLCDKIITFDEMIERKD